jgi:hypothetical protein
MTTARKPMTREEAKRYIFAGWSRIDVYNNISKNMVSFEITQACSFNGFEVHMDPNIARYYDVHQGNYWFMGVVDSNAPWRLIPVPKFTVVEQGHTNWMVFTWLLRVLHNGEPLRKDVEIFISGIRCACCGKYLKDAKSLKRGFGPHCWKKIMENERKEVTR